MPDSRSCSALTTGLGFALPHLIVDMAPSHVTSACCRPQTQATTVAAAKRQSEPEVLGCQGVFAQSSQAWLERCRGQSHINSYYEVAVMRQESG